MASIITGVTGSDFDDWSLRNWTTLVNHIVNVVLVIGIGLFFIRMSAKVLGAFRSIAWKCQEWQQKYQGWWWKKASSPVVASQHSAEECEELLLQKRRIGVEQAMKQSTTAPDGAQLHDEDAPPRFYGRQSFNGRRKIRCSANLVISDTAWSIVGPLSVRLEKPSKQQRICHKVKRGDCRLLGKRILNLIPRFFGPKIEMAAMENVCC